jgi:hypothetical protein
MAKRFSLDDAVSRYGDSWYTCPLLFLVPLSWTGISVEDTEPLPADDLPFRTRLSRPFRIRTVPLHITCAAFVRIISAESKDATDRLCTLVDLESLLACNFFVTYEGNYAEDEKPDERDEKDMQAAVSAINSWDYPARDYWIKDAILKAMTGEISYYDLPSRETALATPSTSGGGLVTNEDDIGGGG